MKIPADGCMFPEDSIKFPLGHQKPGWSDEPGCGCPGMGNMGKEAMLKRIQEIKFACIDLNLFLDTHPHEQKALTLYKSLAFQLDALMKEYQTKYGPIVPQASSAQVPFEWVSEKYLWPWQKKGE